MRAFSAESGARRRVHKVEAQSNRFLVRTAHPTGYLQEKVHDGQILFFIRRTVLLAFVRRVSDVVGELRRRHATAQRGRN